MKKRKSYRRKGKLSNRIIFYLTVSVVLVLSISAIRLAATLAEAELTKFEKTAKNINRYINHEVEELTGVLKQINAFYESGLLYSNGNEEVKNYMEKGLREYSGYCDGVFLLKNLGKENDFIYYSLSSKEKEVGLSETLLAEYAENLEKGNAQFLYHEKESGKIFFVKEIYPWRVDKKSLLGVELSDRFFDIYLKDLEIYNQASTGITTKEGEILFHTEKELVGTSLFEMVEQEEQLEFKEFVQENSHLTRRENGNLEQMEVYHKGDNIILYLPLYMDFMNTEWGMFFEVPLKTLEESAVKLIKDIAIWGIVTIVLLNVLIKLIVRRALKPIDSILSLMHSVRAGNYSKRVEIHSCSEMETIGTGLNHLLDDVVQDREQLIQQKKEISDLLSEIENLMQENDRIYYETIKSLAKTIDAKDPYTGGHCDRVSEIALLIGRKVGLSQEEMTHLSYGAMLHDIGKIGISEGIITKEGRLTEEEYIEIKTHPQRGYEIVKNIHFLKEASMGVLYHHERFDGKGYPEGLQGEKIPFIARIISLADAYDAITSNRSYRKALSKEEARKEIEKNKGLQFDPILADVLLEATKKNEIFF